MVTHVGIGELITVPPSVRVRTIPPIVILVSVVGTGMTMVVAEFVTGVLVVIVVPAVTVRVIVVVEAGTTLIPMVLVTVGPSESVTLIHDVVVDVNAGKVRVLVSVWVTAPTTVVKLD